MQMRVPEHLCILQLKTVSGSALSVFFLFAARLKLASNLKFLPLGVITTLDLSGKRLCISAQLLTMTVQTCLTKMYAVVVDFTCGGCGPDSLSFMHSRISGNM